MDGGGLIQTSVGQLWRLGNASNESLRVFCIGRFQDFLA